MVIGKVSGGMIMITTGDRKTYITPVSQREKVVRPRKLLVSEVREKMNHNTVEVPSFMKDRSERRRSRMRHLEVV